MTIDLIVRETLDGKLADVRVPRTDIAAIKRDGGRRRRKRYAAAAVATFLAVAGTTAALLVTPAPEPAVKTSSVPAMDFTSGARGVYDPQTGLTYLGGESFDLGEVYDLGTSGVATPYGLVYFGSDQSVRFLPADGRVRTLAPAPADAEKFTPTARYDNARSSVAWLTRSSGEVTMTVYSLVGPAKRIGSFPVPCDGDCAALRVAGHDQGLVFVSGSEGTRVIDPSVGADATWVDVTDGRVVDVRSRVMLSVEPEGAPTELPLALADGTWRLEAATSDDSVLSFDGSWEVRPEDPWRFLPNPAADDFTLPIPEGTGPMQVAVDSDNSVLVSMFEGDQEVFWDCDYYGQCAELARIPGTDSGSGFVGDRR